MHFNTYFPILLIFFESLKIALINMVGFLMMSAKLATQGLYDVIMSVHDVTGKILLLELKYSVDVAM